MRQAGQSAPRSAWAASCTPPASLAWRGGQALGLRILGWVLLVTALVIPSTLTLGLPVVALLVVPLASIPEQVVQDGSTS
jgi:hypothetical protein